MASLILQRALGELMQQVVLLLQLVDARKKQLNLTVIMRKELKETMRAVVQNLTTVMIPYVYFKSIIKLLRHADKNVGKKVWFLSYNKILLGSCIILIQR